DNYFIELMHHGLSIEQRVSKDLLEVAKALNAPLGATHDLPSVTEADHQIQDTLLCLHAGSRMTDPDRFKFSGSGYYLQPAREVRELFKEFPEACDNTLRIAEMCEVEFPTADEGANYMPHFATPSGEDEESWFVKEVQRGLEYRYPSGIPNEVQSRADYDASVILT